MTAYSPIRWPQPGDAAERRGRRDRTPRLTSDRERHERRADGGPRPRRGSPRPVAEVPRRARGSGEGRVRLTITEASGQLDHGQLRDEHGPGAREALHDGRVEVEALIAVWSGAPRGEITSGRQ